MNEQFNVLTRIATERHEKILELEAEIARLREALQNLWDEVNNVRYDLGTNYPALAEAWARASFALSPKDELKGKVE